jgi:hypothetical protein
MFRVRNGSVAKLNWESMGQLVGPLGRGLRASQGLLPVLFFLRRYIIIDLQVNRRT